VICPSPLQEFSGICKKKYWRNFAYDWVKAEEIEQTELDRVDAYPLAVNMVRR
jgi:hypothetical protein